MWVERLHAGHRIDDFACGKKPLDDWLAQYALENAARGLSAVYVLTDDGAHIIGYYSLTMGGVERAELPRRLGRGLPSVDIGAVLLGRLAIDLRYQGDHLGRGLLREAVERAARGAIEIAARFIAVDPIDEEARAWYTRQGFQSLEGDDRMYVRISDVLAALTDDA